jgi:anti-anti-sigma factor
VRESIDIGIFLYPARRMTRPPEFRILTNGSGSQVEIAIEGELDLATAPRLDAELARVAALDGLEQVVVDLRGLAFLDSIGLESIVEFDTTMRGRGVAIAVVRGPRAVERLFAVMQLDHRLRIVDDPAEL